jgi:hypothetical protein
MAIDKWLSNLQMENSFYDGCKTDPDFFDVIEKHGFDEDGNVKFIVKRVQYTVVTFTQEQIKQDREEKTGVGDFINSCENHDPLWEWETDSDVTKIQFLDEFQEKG